MSSILPCTSCEKKKTLLRNWLVPYMLEDWRDRSRQELIFLHEEDYRIFMRWDTVIFLSYSFQLISETTRQKYFNHWIHESMAAFGINW
jgi:hypothetical protein